jgi:hypothetical protein
VSKASDPWPYLSYIISLSSIHIGLHALILLPKPHTLVMLSQTVTSIVQVFPSLWCWVWLVLVLRVLVFHLSWCEATVVRIDAVVWAWVGMVEMVGFRQVMWFVILKSAKEWVLGVDTPGQQVPPRIWYGMACLLIRYVVDSESCSVVWGKTQDMIWSTKCKRGSSHKETLALPVGTPRSGKTVAKHD